MNIPSLVNSLVRIPIYQFSVLFDKIAIVWLIRGSIGQFILWAILSIFHLCIILLASLFCLTRRGANWPAVYFARFFSQRQTTFWRLILRIELSLTMKQIVFLDFSPNVIQSAIKSLKSLRSQALPFVIFFFSADAVYWYVTVWLCQYSIASWAHCLEKIMRSQVSDRSHGSNAIFTRFRKGRFTRELFLFWNLSSRFHFFVHRGSLFDSNSNINQSARFVHCQNCPPLGGYLPKLGNSQTSGFLKCWQPK